MKAELSPLYQRRTVHTVSDTEVLNALASNATARRILAKNQPPQPGDLVGVRVSINIIKSTGVAVQTIHAGSRSAGYKVNKGFFNRPVVGYEKVVTLRDAYFNVAQLAREQIASNRDSKSPMASVDGTYVETVRPDFDGIEVRFNPHKLHLFTDLQNRPIHYAEHVTIYAHRAYVRGEVRYYTAEDAPARAGDAPSEVRFEPQPYAAVDRTTNALETLTHPAAGAYGVCTPTAIVRT